MISIIIRTKNEASSIARVLELIQSQKGVPAPEIIVVDSGSTDSTVEIVKRYSSVKILFYEKKPFSFGGALNFGFSEAKGEILVALSAHAFPADPDWLNHLTRPFEDEKVAGVYGRQLPHENAWPPVEREFQDSGYKAVFSNANSALRRSCWEKHPFNESLPHAEDIEWSQAMTEAGFEVRYETRAAVYHSHNEPLFVIFDRNYRGIMGQKMAGHYKERRWGILWALSKWLRETGADIIFVIKKRKNLFWIAAAPIYRLFWTAGLIAPDMPGALWKPFFRIIRKGIS